MIRLAVFDCDGTIVDSQHAVIQSMSSAFSDFSLPTPEDTAIRRVIGLPLIRACKILAPEESPARHEELRQSYSAHWQRLRAEGGLYEPLYPGFREAMSILEEEGWIFGVATGKSHRGLIATLEKHEMIDKFATLQTADRARGKPHPEMLLNAISETGATAANTVMIGDTVFDIEMAVNAKVRAIGVSWGYHDTHELLASGAEVVLSDYSELPLTLA